MSEYPPPQHMLRDLRIEFSGAAEGGTLAPLVPELLHSAGSLRIGAAGILCDVMAGGPAIASVLPDWALTSDLTVHLGRPAREGTLRGTTRVLRAGKTTIVLELELHQGGANTEAVAYATSTFTRVQRRDTMPSLAKRSDSAHTFAGPKSRLPGPLLDALRIRVADAAAGHAEIELIPYVANSVGALQGGAVLCLADAAAEALGRHVTGEPIVTTDLGAHYIALGKTGPIATRARVVRRHGDQVVVAVKLYDRGQDDRLMTVVTATVGPPPS
jgi:acyl-coenzyme A thioesterase PaaI-like protein